MYRLFSEKASLFHYKIFHSLIRLSGTLSHLSRHLFVIIYYNLIQVKCKYFVSGYIIVAYEVICVYPRIRNMREDHDLSQTKLAKKLGMSQTGYSKYETGENDIPTPILIALAELYQTSIDYLLGLTDVQEPYPHI